MLVSLAMLLAQGSVPDIDPSAERLYDRMRATYASLQSLECTVIDNPGPYERRARLGYRRPGTILVQALDAKGESERERRVTKGEVTASSPHSPLRYVRYRLDPKATFRTAWVEATSGLSSPAYELGTLLGETAPTTNVSRFVAMRLGARTKAGDGTPVDVLTVEREVDIPTSPVRWGWRGRTTYQIGVADSLIRRLEREGGHVDDRVDRAVFEYRELYANRGIPDRAFAYRPPEGAVAVAPVRYNDVSDPKSAAFVAEMRAALLRLDSLSIVVRRADDSQRTVDDAGNPVEPPGRATVRFDLKRPLLARGEARLVLSSRDERAWVVSDGTTLYWGPSGPRGARGVPLRDPSAIAWFGQDGRPGYVGQVACEVAEWFFDVAGERGRYRFRGFRLGKPVVVGGETYDVLFQKFPGTDRYGIPDGRVTTASYFVGRKDRLIHGHQYGASPREWIAEVVPNAEIPPERFAPVP